MPYKITEDCASCGSCEVECPNQAISEGASIYWIAPDLCTECVGAYPNPRCAEVCPLGAPVLDGNHRENHDRLLTKWKKLHPGQTPR